MTLGGGHPVVPTHHTANHGLINEYVAAWGGRADGIDIQGGGMAPGRGHPVVPTHPHQGTNTWGREAVSQGGIIQGRVTSNGGGHKEGMDTKLKKIDENFNPLVYRTKHLSQVPESYVHVTNHIVSTPYIFDCQKCNNRVCCGTKQTPTHIIELSMQRQSTPCLASSRDGHLLS